MNHVVVPQYHLEELRQRHTRNRRLQEHAQAVREAKGRHRYRSRQRR